MVGSFSGVRINAAVTQALAWSNDLPVIPVSTLQALAQAAYRLHGLTEVSAVLDARMSEVYIASYQLDTQGIMQPVDDEQLLNYAEGRQAVKYTRSVQELNWYKVKRQFIKCARDRTGYCQHRTCSSTNQNWVSAELALPVYLRDNAWKKFRTR